MLHIILQYTKQINLSTYIYIRKTETFIGTPTQLPARGIAKPGLRTVCTRAPFFFAPDIDSQNQLSCARLSIKLHSFAPGCQTVGSRCRCVDVEVSSCQALFFCAGYRRRLFHREWSGEFMLLPVALPRSRSRVEPRSFALSISSFVFLRRVSPFFWRRVFTEPFLVNVLK